jgi:hypothetical protein
MLRACGNKFVGFVAQPIAAMAMAPASVETSNGVSCFDPPELKAKGALNRLAEIARTLMTTMSRFLKSAKTGHSVWLLRGRPTRSSITNLRAKSTGCIT